MTIYPSNKYNNSSSSSFVVTSWKFYINEKISSILFHQFHPPAPPFSSFNSSHSLILSMMMTKNDRQQHSILFCIEMSKFTTKSTEATSQMYSVTLNESSPSLTLALSLCDEVCFIIINVCCFARWQRMCDVQRFGREKYNSENLAKSKNNKATGWRVAKAKRKNENEEINS